VLKTLLHGRKKAEESWVQVLETFLDWRRQLFSSHIQCPG